MKIFARVLFSFVTIPFILVGAQVKADDSSDINQYKPISGHLELRGDFRAPDRTEQNGKEIPGLIWEGPLLDNAGHSKLLTQSDATAYCKSRERRLPTETEYYTLASDMGFPHRYKPQLFKGMSGKYWAAPAFSEESEYGYRFNADTGAISDSIDNQ
jgi:hypothetical protein